MNAPPERVGFVGIGKMGAAMAARLHAAGYRLAVHDLRTDAAQAFADSHAGAVMARTLDALADCDVVITMLPDSAAVEAVVLGQAAAAGLIGRCARARC